jgi:hypothetical protein
MIYVFLEILVLFLILLYIIWKVWGYYMKTHWSCQSQINFNNVKLENLKTTQETLLRRMSKNTLFNFASLTFEQKKCVVERFPGFEDVSLHKRRSFSGYTLKSQSEVVPRGVQCQPEVFPRVKSCGGGGGHRLKNITSKSNGFGLTWDI